MRHLLIIAALAILSGCGPADKYSDTPYPKGPWVPANKSPDSNDNNILPDFAQGVQS